MPTELFHPSVRRWFRENIGSPSPPQVRGWPLIRAGGHVLIAAPTGSGKTLTAFLNALDLLLTQGDALPDETRVLYISPLKALSNDIGKNLERPLAELRALDPTLPEVRVFVRTGDTSQGRRQAMRRKPPHIVVTTPESLYLMLTSAGGRELLRTVRHVIVDEIHALARDKRGSHLALSLERLSALAGDVQRIGLSATQRPLDLIARFLGGEGREVSVVDAGHLRELDLAIEIPSSPLGAVCSHEVWDEIYTKMAGLIEAHRTTLVFVNTRKLAERASARLAEYLGEDKVRCHHGSLSKEIRLEAEERLKSGDLRALVATASLELGIDIGDVDLAIQIGSSRSIATFLQRMGRAGHGVGRIPKGRAFPLTRDELVEAAALLKAVRDGELDRITVPKKPLDIMAQQVVAACVAEDWDEDALFRMVRRAGSYTELERDEFDAFLEIHSKGRAALLHRDSVGGTVRATKRARMRAISNGGAIPDLGDYRVVLEPDGVVIGSLNEDFAIESNRGDIFQLGSTSWRVLRIEPGVVRVADAKGAPPSLPFWIGESPGRTIELSAAIGRLRGSYQDAETLGAEYRLDPEPARQIAEYLDESKRVLGELPTQTLLIAERFFDEAGGTQIVLHTPFGSRINKALGLALRKRICRGFGFELQAAANDEAIVFSLGEKPGIPLEQIFEWLHPRTVEEVLVQAVLATPLFETRFRWAATRALLVERSRHGKRVPLLLQRMRANDVLLDAFPQSLACPETLATPDLPVPMDHPLVRQAILDCVREAMDLDGCRDVLEGLRDGSIVGRVIDTSEPSPLSHEVLNAQPYAFLDDAPLEERRTRAVMTRRTLSPKEVDEVGALDPAAVARVQDEAWPRPENKEEVHEALGWMGFITDAEIERSDLTLATSDGSSVESGWRVWIGQLVSDRRVVVDDAGTGSYRYFAVEASRDPRAVWRGRLEALGPVFSDDPALDELVGEGSVWKARIDGRDAYCDRRLLQRIRRYTLDRLREAIEPVSATDLLRFLACWQHADPEFRLEGPRGVAEVVRKLAGFEAPVREWERSILPARVKDYRREWLDEVMLTGEVAWGRLFGAGKSAIKSTPISLFMREDLDRWVALAGAPPHDELGGDAADLLALLTRRGPQFPAELRRRSGLLPSRVDDAVAELVARGFVSADSFAALRSLHVPPSRRGGQIYAAGRLSLFRGVAEDGEAADPGRAASADEVTPDVGGSTSDAAFVARQLLHRTGVVFRRLIARERIPVPWRDLLRVYRRMELRGEVRGGRFVAGFDGEQYAVPDAVDRLRAARRRGERAPLDVSAADPLNLRGILTPDDRVPSGSRDLVRMA